jgi:branched-chain amino acid transport system permease protein
MSVTTDAPAAQPMPAVTGRPPRLPSIRTKATPPRVITLAIIVLAVMFLLPAVLNTFWMTVMLSVVIYSAVALGLGLLIGRVGLVSLCQVPLFALGAWVALRLHFATDMPFPLLIIFAALTSGAVGVVIGLPALRLSGLYLALITLMGTGALTLLLKIAQFPNGGPGFFGFDKAGGSTITSLPRPSVAESDNGYYRYCVVVVAILFLVAAWHFTGKPGRAWASIRRSQVTAVAAGVNTTLYKLWAFALGSAITGAAGALLAAGPGGVSTAQFPVADSFTLLAVVLMAGTFNIWGAVVAAMLMKLLPKILDETPLPTEALTILFGIGVIHAVTTAPGGIVSQLPDIPKMLAARKAKRNAASPSSTSPPAAAPATDVVHAP